MKAQTLRQVRQFHNYIAVFFSPAILFFAFTGGLQTAGLHERHGDYTPPRWIAVIASLHQHQVPSRVHRHHDDDHHAPGAPPAGPAHHDDDHDQSGFIAEKPFVLLLAIALFVTTALGLVIALATPSTRRTSWILFAAGIVVPVLLLLV